MKPVAIGNITASDRIATWEEVHCAMSFTPIGALHLRCTSDGYCEMKSDFYGWIRIKNENLERWASLGLIQTPDDN